MGTARTVEEIGQELGIQGASRPHGWLEYVVKCRMRRAQAKARAKREAGAYADVAPEERARSVVRWACAKAAVTGALSGAVSTVAVVATTETEGFAGVIAIPFAAATIGAEMAARSVFHIDLTCELAEIFGVRLENDDVVRLLSLAVGADGDGDEKDLGQARVTSATVDREELFERAGHLLLGESLLRNALPFIGVVSSAVTNIVVTRRLGRRVRRSFRYERAMLDALRDATRTCASCMDLLIEGLWFVFIADGRLSTEETATLAQRLDDLDDEQRRNVLAHFTDDETDWIEHLKAVPQEARDDFFRVLEIAAALDKSVPLPEEKLLRRVAQVFGREYDAHRVRRIVEQLEQTGVLS